MKSVKPQKKNRSVTEPPKTSDSSNSSPSSDSSSSKEEKKSAKDPVKKANENYQEDVVYGQQAGFGMGSFGSAKADATIKDSTTVAEQMKLRLSGGEDIRGEIGNVVDGYSLGLSESKFDMLGKDSATMDSGQGFASGTVSFGDSTISVVDSTAAAHGAGGVALGDTNFGGKNSTYNNYNSNSYSNGSAMMYH